MLKNELLFLQLFEAKKLAWISTISLLRTEASKKMILEQIWCIYYLLYFQKNKESNL